MIIISELVLVDDGEAVLLHAEDLVHLEAGEPVLLDADLVFGLVCVNVEACKIVELFRELRADPTLYLESVPLTMTIISELVLVDDGEAVLLDAEDLVHLDAGEPVLLDTEDLVFGIV